MSQQEKPATHCGLFFRFEFYEKTRLGVICTETVQKLERTMRNAKKIVKFWTLMSLALSVTALTANAQIYKSVDENGVVTFSDTRKQVTYGRFLTYFVDPTRYKCAAFRALAKRRVNRK